MTISSHCDPVLKALSSLAIHGSVGRLIDSFAHALVTESRYQPLLRLAKVFSALAIRSFNLFDRV